MSVDRKSFILSIGLAGFFPILPFNEKQEDRAAKAQYLAESISEKFKRKGILDNYPFENRGTIPIIVTEKISTDIKELRPEWTIEMDYEGNFALIKNKRKNK